MDGEAARAEVLKAEAAARPSRSAAPPAASAPDQLQCAWQGAHTAACRRYAAGVARYAGLAWPKVYCGEGVRTARGEGRVAPVLSV